MADTADLTVRLSGDLKDFVEREVSAGSYESADEFIRDLIRRRREEAGYWSFEHTKAELQRAFAAPESDYVRMTFDDFMKGARSK